MKHRQKTNVSSTSVNSNYVNFRKFAEKMVRVRFAPSPTGPLHIGGVRTALYNFLFARKHNGTFILRIEDTDQQRFVPGAEQYIIESLTWCGILFDEGPHLGGPNAPYRQSERKEIYQSYIQTLIDKGHAYYAFETPEELEELRQNYQAKGQTFQYDSQTRMQLKNSLSLPEYTWKAWLREGRPYVVRFLNPENTTVTFDDLIRGNIEVHSNTLDDKVLFKSDGLPTYHLANVVDDHLMGITHVIRGEEWLPSAPLHVLMYQAFGWQRPAFAHLPLLLKPDGKGKLSKRDGDRLGFPVFPLEWKDPFTGEITRGYREDGYLPEAVVNILALLGWNPGNDKEIMTIDELINLFSLDRISKSGAHFDLQKAQWINKQYIIASPIEKLVPLVKNYYAKHHQLQIDEALLSNILPHMKERAETINELAEKSLFFFQAPKSYNEKVLKKHFFTEAKQVFDQLCQMLSQINWDERSIDAMLQAMVENHQLTTGKFYNLIRLALVGDAYGPHLSTIMVLLGREETIQRLHAFQDVLTKNV